MPGRTASKVNGAAAEIVLGADAQGDRISLSVADHGPGIPDAERGRVVERFVRLEQSRSLPGSGLGLSLASAVARLHGGELKLEDNHPGLRTVLALPRAGPATCMMRRPASGKSAETNRQPAVERPRLAGRMAGALPRASRAGPRARSPNGSRHRADGAAGEALTSPARRASGAGESARAASPKPRRISGSWPAPIRHACCGF